jgi:hypothetical protein
MAVFMWWYELPGRARLTGTYARWLFIARQWKTPGEAIEISEGYMGRNCASAGVFVRGIDESSEGKAASGNSHA